ncbi:metal ABC transporter solute-binding protein, Zn/Mn family, partial [Burkholderia multivorans]|uniref:metal ABC transporter solute-binding protein, Zn/Mn family n=1 Tax=Burkholderia multivorans TaxID=87883 RepID=UPI0018DD0166
MAMPFITGLMNIVVPLQIGARDVAYPFLNSLSFWLFGAGVALMMISLFVGEFAATGWLAYPPLSGLDYSPSVGVDYYIWALQISGLGTTLSGINFIVTILRMRAPGMTLMKMPIFTWTSLVTNVLIVAAFPVLAATLALLAVAPVQAKEKFKVITTFTVIADMAQNVAGDAADVSSITKPGAEIHEYQPTPGDIKRAQGAQLILANGLNLELWFARFYQHLNGVPEVVVSNGIQPMG